MDGNKENVASDEHTTDIKPIPISPQTEAKKARQEEEKLLEENVKIDPFNKKKKNVGKSIGNFFYNPQKKTVLGRTALNWAKLAAFYTVFYFCLGCFFVGLLYLFALLIDRDIPRHVNTESTMAVRTSATVVGLGFRPQPDYDDSLIQITNDRDQQEATAKSLRIYRDVFLVQKPDAKVEVCSRDDPAIDLPKGVACSFDWYDVVKTEDHPCSDRNLFGLKKEEPCVLVKINKVYDWTPDPGPTPLHIQKIRGSFSDKSETNSDVYITCSGSNPADNDVLTDLTYYSIGDINGSNKYGIIPNYYFPYRNARDHVQPFVLVQFKKLPANRLVSVTCKLWAAGVRHDTRAMRGMVNFQLHRAT